MSRFTDKINRMGESVEDFNRRFQVQRQGDVEKMLVRLMEEVGEVANAVNQADMDDAAAELADVLFVTMDALYCLGDNGEEAIFGVTQKNNAKTLETHYVHPLSRRITRRIVPVPPAEPTGAHG